MRFRVRIVIRDVRAASKSNTGVSMEPGQLHGTFPQAV
jgi:hypothetical protein